MLRPQPVAPQQRAIGLRLQIAVAEQRYRQRQLGFQPFAGNHDAAGAGVVKTDADALNRRIGIERQPAGTGLGNRQLHHQQVEAARQPQADQLARPHTGGNQVVRSAVGGVVQLGVGQRAIGKCQRDFVRATLRSGFEQVGQGFVEQQVGAVGATNDQGCSSFEGHGTILRKRGKRRKALQLTFGAEIR